METDLLVILNNLYQDKTIEFILAFVLIFAIFYSILSFANFFKHVKSHQKNRISALMSVILSLVVVVPHITGTYEKLGFFNPVKLILELLVKGSAFLIVLFLFVVIGSIFGKKNIKLASFFLFCVFLFLIFYLVEKYNIISSLPFALKIFVHPIFLVIAICIFILIILFGGSDSKKAIRKDIRKSYYDDEDDDFLSGYHGYHGYH